MATTKRGNPHIEKNFWDKEKAREMALRSHEARTKKKELANAFKATRSLVDFAAPKELVNESIMEFWKRRGVARDRITPLMAETTPMYAEAIAQKDIKTLKIIYELYGVTFESNKEHNVKVSLSNDDDKPLKHDISGGLKIEFVEKKPEPIET